MATKNGLTKTDTLILKHPLHAAGVLVFSKKGAYFLKRMHRVTDFLTYSRPIFPLSISETACGLALPLEAFIT